MTQPMRGVSIAAMIFVLIGAIVNPIGTGDFIADLLLTVARLTGEILNGLGIILERVAEQLGNDDGP